MEWIKIQDQMPPEGIKFIICYKTNEEYSMQIIEQYDGQTHADGHCCRLEGWLDKDDYWMPLPEKPRN